MARAHGDRAGAGPGGAGVSASSPRSGDWVRAVADSRDAEAVEGILHLRYVPSLRYVQVNVIADGGLRNVRHDSIEVVRPGEVPVGELEASDPLVGDEGWRRILDMDQARAEGLLPQQVERLGGTWDDMFAAMHERVVPLLDAGWLLTGREHEESWEHGNSVFYDVERGTTHLNLEYYEHGQFVAYPNEERPEEDWDGDPTEPYFSIYDTTPATCRSAFEEHGWLRPAGPRQEGKFTIVNPRGKTSKEIHDLMTEGLGLNERDEDEDEDKPKS